MGARMNSRLVSRIFSSGLFVTLTGCSTMYVGNIEFSKDQVCSKEYSSILGDLWPGVFSGLNGDCLPPVPVANVQRYYFDRFRLPIYVDWSKDKGGSELDEELSSIVGRVFAAGEIGDKEWAPTNTGNIAFLPLLNEDVSAQDTKPLRVLKYVKTSIAAADERRREYNVVADAESVLKMALGNNSVFFDKIKSKPGYSDLIAGIIGFGSSKSSLNMSMGEYVYYSVEYNQLAQLIMLFNECDWTMIRETKTTRQGILGIGSGGYPFGRNDKDGNKVLKKCEMSDAGNEKGRSFDDGVIRRLRRISELADKYHNIEHIGMVVGVAVLRTRSATSLSCGSYFLGIGNKSGDSGDSGGICGKLKDRIDKFVNGQNPGVDFNDVKEVIPSSVDLVSVVNAVYNGGAAKKMNMEDHASVLAIQWVPLDIRKKRDNSKTVESGH